MWIRSLCISISTTSVIVVLHEWKIKTETKVSAEVVNVKLLDIFLCIYGIFSYWDFCWVDKKWVDNLFISTNLKHLDIWIYVWYQGWSVYYTASQGFKVSTSDERMFGQGFSPKFVHSLKMLCPASSRFLYNFVFCKWIYKPVPLGVIDGFRFARFNPSVHCLPASAEWIHAV